MYRGIRPLTLTYQGESITIDMLGWYTIDGDEDSIHSGEDMKVSDRALNCLKAHVHENVEQK